MLRGSNSATVLDGTFHATGDPGVGIQEMRYVPIGDYVFDLYVKLGPFSSLSTTVTCGGTWAPEWTNTGSGSNPASSVDMPAHYALLLGNNIAMYADLSEVVFNDDSNEIDFRVESDSNTHAFYVDAGNNAKIGIGTSTPQSVNDASSGISIGNGSGSARIQLTSNGGGCLYAGEDPVNSNTTGFRMGHLNGTNRLEMSVNNNNSFANGVVLSAGGTSWGTFSDERRKTDLVEIADGLNKVATLRAVTGRYNYDDVSVRRAMLIAQDVQAVLPEAVDSMTATMDDPTEYLTLNYSETIPLLVSALKDAKTLIETLEARITALENS
jgi:hypothetical protein